MPSDRYLKLEEKLAAAFGRYFAKQTGADESSGKIKEDGSKCKGATQNQLAALKAALQIEGGKS